ncbi:hypothetical protein QQ045_003827 [Rhodiola kirilowii]
MKIFLGSMYLDLALRESKPIHLANARSPFNRNHLRMWEHSNMLSLMIIHRGNPEVFRGIVPDEISSAKDYLAEFEKQYSQFKISYNCQREKWTLNEVYDDLR